MRIAFVDFSPLDYHVHSVESAPLGGTQSAVCYLARSLAAAGHTVTVLSDTRAPGRYDGVECLAWRGFRPQMLRDLALDVAVSVSGVASVIWLQGVLDERTAIVPWIQHAKDQSAVQPLRDPVLRSRCTGWAFVSDWQASEFIREFQLEPDRAGVLRNAISPRFAGLFASNENILNRKAFPPRLAYTSTPFRGLDRLLQAFPKIRDAVPGTTLRVFSSLSVYQAPREADEQIYGALYNQCRTMAGVEYVGAIPQPDLARELTEVSLLAYPNTFAETSCIAVMEAMAAGCRVVTSDLAALPETTAGFARLVPQRLAAAYVTEFAEQVIGALREFESEPDRVEQSLRAQVRFFNESATWVRRASEWEAWLVSLPRRDARPPAIDCAALARTAENHFQAGRITEADRLCRFLLDVHPHAPDTLHLFGRLAQRAGAHDQAQTLFARAAALRAE